MDLNQVTIGVTNVPEAIAFYEGLGLACIVHDDDDDYARFECPAGEATFSVHRVDEVMPSSTLIYFEVDNVDALIEQLGDIAIDHGPKDESWLWREARIRDPFGNPLCIFHAGENRKNPPWRKQDKPREAL